MIAVLSILCLLVTAVLAGLAVFHPWYRDGLLERVGLSAVAVWCGATAAAVGESMRAEPVPLMLHAGLAAYAVGAALRVRRDMRHPHCRRATDPPPAPVGGLRHAASSRRHRP